METQRRYVWLGPAMISGVLAGSVMWTGMAPLFITAIMLGWVFVWSDFGYTSGFRNVLTGGDGSVLISGLLVAAVAALLIVPMSNLRDGYAGTAVPIGLPLIFGAAMFGMGMQIANGCGSGTMYGAGSLSRRLLIALPAFCVGGVLGAALLPAASRLPDLGTFDFGERFGPWGGLATTETLLGVIMLLLWHGGPRPLATQIRAALIIGLLAALAFLLSGHPWGITFGLTLWGAKAAGVLGFDLANTAFWSWNGNRQALAGSILENHSSLMDVGLLLGAMMAASVHGQFKYQRPLSLRGGLGAVSGGLLMGIGARLSGGCNIGAMVGGMSSGSLHGFVWLLAALPGCWLGIRLRPIFGLPP